MADDLRHQIRASFEQMTTEDLLAIWCENDRHEWSNTTFEVIRDVLEERHVEVPSQGRPVYAEHRVDVSSLPVEREYTSQQIKPVGPSRATREPELVAPRPKTVVYAVYLGFAALAVQAVQLAVAAGTGQFDVYRTMAVAGLAAFVGFEAGLIRGA
jgi:hypothetical protein